jgi:hypothetical protein
MRHFHGHFHGHGHFRHFRHLRHFNYHYVGGVPTCWKWAPRLGRYINICRYPW